MSSLETVLNLLDYAATPSAVPTDAAQESPVALSIPATAKIRLNGDRLEQSVNGGQWLPLTAGGDGTTIPETIEMAGTGLEVTNRNSGQPLRIIGTTSLQTISAGSNSGAAGVGTTTTSLVKPTGASNWTSSDLVGLWLEITGGPGYIADGDNLRPIVANSTTAITVAAVSNMAAGTTFRIAAVDQTVDWIDASSPIGILLTNCRSSIELYALNFKDTNVLTSLISAENCSDLYIHGCEFGQNLSSPAVEITDCDRVRIDHCFMWGGADADITGTSRLTVTNPYLLGAGVLGIEDCFVVRVVDGISLSSVSTSLSLVNCMIADVGFKADSAGDTPVYLEGVQRFQVSGNGLTGTNAGADYGVEVATSGRYNFAGATIAGAGEILFIGNPETWSILSGTDYGIATEHATAAFANANYNKSHHYGNELHFGEQQFSARALFYGVVNPSQITGVTATGTATGDAYVIPQQQFVRVDTTPANSGVRIYSPAVAAVPGPEIFIINKGANTLKVYPPTGGQIDGGGADVAYSLSAGAKKRFVCISDNRLLWESY